MQNEERNRRIQGEFIQDMKGTKRDICGSIYNGNQMDHGTSMGKNFM